MSGICPCTMGNSVSRALFGLRDAKKQTCDAPVHTAKAEVLSRIVRHSNTIYHESPWQYLVTFRLDDGRDAQLLTDENVYGQLKEGTVWQISWQAGHLTAFE